MRVQHECNQSNKQQHEKMHIEADTTRMSSSRYGSSKKFTEQKGYPLQHAKNSVNFQMTAKRAQEKQDLAYRERAGIQDINSLRCMSKCIYIYVRCGYYSTGDNLLHIILKCIWQIFA